MSSFAFAKTFTPILNTPDFTKVFGGKDGGSLLLDDQGLLRAVETVAFTNTKFKILKQINDQIVQVEMSEYPCAPLFVDQRFLYSAGAERKKVIPPFLDILNHLKSLIGAIYIWGGNASCGIPELLHYFPPTVPLDKKMQQLWTLKGVDCSGLLYEATNGFTPRNTSWLVHFGQAVDIENRSINQIANLVKPLDIIVWPGHVIIVLDTTLCIESRPQTGVAAQPLKDRLIELQRKPLSLWDSKFSAKDHFVIRRWYS